MSYYVKTLHFVFDVSCSGSMSASHCGKYCRWGGVGAWLNCKVIAQLCLSMRKGNTDNRMSAHPVCISLLHWLFFLHAQTELCYNLTVSSRCSLRQRAEIKPRSLSFFFFIVRITIWPRPEFSETSWKPDFGREQVCHVSASSVHCAVCWPPSILCHTGPRNM